MSYDLGNGEFATGIPYQPTVQAPPATPEPNPETPSAYYEEMAPKWRMVDDLWGGTATMIDAATRWLPSDLGESNESYNLRLVRSVFFNAFKRTVQFLVGKPLSKPVALSSEMDADIKEWTENIDQGGQDIQVFSKQALEEMIKDGHNLFMVDFAPTDGSAITITEAKTKNLRPYIIRIDPRNFVAWRTAIIDGKEVLVHCRFREIVTEPIGQWGEQECVYIKVFDRLSEIIEGSTVAQTVVKWRKYKRVQANDKQQAPTYELVSAGYIKDGSGKYFEEIPIVAAYGTRTGCYRSSPSLEDLMWLNVQHWRSSSDQNNILHITRVPIKFAKGFIPGASKDGTTPAKLVIAGDRIIATDSEHADFKYVEHNGNSIGAGAADLDTIQSQMAMLGAEKLAKRTVTSTATEEIHDNTAEDSELASMCYSLEDAFATCFIWMARFAGKDESTAGTVSFNKDFGIFPWQMQNLAYLVQLRQDRQISQKTLLAEFQRYGALSDTLDVPAEITTTKPEQAELQATMAASRRTSRQATAQPKTPPQTTPAGPGQY